MGKSLRYDNRKSKYLPVTKYTNACGMDFSKSILNPNGRLLRTVKYLETNGPTTRETLCRMLGEKGPHNRGWGGAFWSLAIKNKYLTKTRKGNSVTYDLGPSFFQMYPIAIVERYGLNDDTPSDTVLSDDPIREL